MTVYAISLVTCVGIGAVYRVFNDISVTELREQAASMLVELTPVEADAIITLYRKALQAVEDLPDDNDFDLTGEYGHYGNED